MAAAICGLEHRMVVEPWPATLRHLVFVSDLHLGWFLANGAS